MPRPPRIPFAGAHYHVVKGVDSVSNLVRRAEQHCTESRKWKHSAIQIEPTLGLNTEHKARPDFSAQAKAVDAFVSKGATLRGPNSTSFSAW